MGDVEIKLNFGAAQVENAKPTHRN